MSLSVRARVAHRGGAGVYRVSFHRMLRRQSPHCRLSRLQHAWRSTVSFASTRAPRGSKLDSTVPMDLNSSSDEEEEAPMAAPPQAEPTQAPIDSAGGATTESNEAVEVAAEAAAVGGLPGLLLSPSLAGLYVIVGRGAPASGGGDQGLPCPAPPEAPPPQPWRSPYVAAAAAEKVALNSSSDDEHAPMAALPQAEPTQAPIDSAGGATTESMDVDEGNEEVQEVEVEAVWETEEEEEEDVDEQDKHPRNSSVGVAIKMEPEGLVKGAQEDPDVYPVDRILGERRRGGRAQLLIRWLGCALPTPCLTHTPRHMRCVLDLRRYRLRPAERGVRRVTQI